LAAWQGNSYFLTMKSSTGLFLQVRQMLFHSLDFEAQLCQIRFEGIDLLRLGLEAPLEMTASAAIAITSAPTLVFLPTITGIFFTFAFFFV
jgi:hypothetical protein